MKKFLALLLIFFTVPCFGYFHYFEEMVAPNDDHTIYLLSDCHSIFRYPDEDIYIEKKKVCDQQRIDLLNIAKRMNGHVTVEDMPFNNDIYSPPSLSSFCKQIEADFKQNSLCFDPNKSLITTLPSISQFQKDNNTLSPLFLLTQFCYQQGIHADNIEFRFMGPTYRIEDYLKYYDMILAKVKTYKDSDQFNAIYSKIISEFESRHQRWSMLLQDALYKMGSGITGIEVIENSAIKLSDYDLGKTVQDNKFFGWGMNEFNKSNYFGADNQDKDLIDLKILHSIHDFKDQYKHIFVCAGGAHINQVRTYLEHLDYKSKLKNLSACLPIMFCNPKKQCLSYEKIKQKKDLCLCRSF